MQTFAHKIFFSYKSQNLFEIQSTVFAVAKSILYISNLPKTTCLSIFTYFSNLQIEHIPFQSHNYFQILQPWKK